MTIKILIFSCLTTISLATASFADARTSEAQSTLNALGLNAGPVDGAWGNKTQTALNEFLDHRGLPPVDALTDEALRELRGQTGVSFPVAPGLDLRINGPRFPSVDSYSRDPNDPTAFTLRIRPNDYDAVDYRNNRNLFSSQDGLNFSKQRSELSSQRLTSNQVYTLDFEVMVSDASAGTFFQLHRADSANVLLAYPDSIRFNAGPDVQNRAVYRGDWLGRWMSVRLVFYPSSGSDSWYRFYVNGEQTLNTEGDFAGVAFQSGVNFAFGSYRGASTRVAEVSYRAIRLSEGDLGAPSL